MADVAGIVARARGVRAVVVGAGAAGLVAGHELAKVGISVTVVDANIEFGGHLRAVAVGDASVEPYARPITPTKELRALLTDLDLDGVLTDAPAIPLAIAGASGTVSEGATEQVLGIPANPWDPAVQRALGTAGVWRAYLDRLRPPLTIGRQRNLGALVRSRMGDRVVARLVAPVTRARFGLSPDAIDVERAAPGLNAALTQTGSLAGAVAATFEQHESRATFAGGMTPMIAALVERSRTLGVDARPSVTATGIRRDGERWTVALLDVDGEQSEVVSDILVVATPEAEARALLPDLPESDAHSVTSDVVLLRMADDNLEPSPHAVASTDPAQWLVEEIGDPGTVVRVTGSHPDLDDTGVLAAAIAAAAQLRPGLTAADVRATWSGRTVTTSAVRSGFTEDVAELHRHVRTLPGLAVVGAWTAGDDLGDVVRDTVAEVDRVRSAALWGAGRSAE